MTVKKKGLLEGKLSLHSKGFGFVSPTNEDHDDVFIPASQLKGSIDGDIVEIAVVAKSAKGFEGKVVRLVKRERKKIVGVVLQVLKTGDAVVYSPVVGEEREIVLNKEAKRKWKLGDRVLMEIEKTTPAKVFCKLTKLFGNIDDASIDTEVAIEEYQIRKEFPKSVLKEALSFTQKNSIKKTNRLDLTDLTCMTIDPVDAKDYDDALSITKDKKGHYHLGVHIADVSHFVQVGSSLDKEAFKRSNSTYFLDGVVPMLPHELSSDLCSLKEKVTRLTASALMEFDPKGNLLKYKIVRSIIKSKKRFTYEGAKEVLDGKQESELLPELKLLVELALILKTHRKSRGSVELSMPEIKLTLDDKGIPNGYRRIEYDITHQMVEEFMLKANEIVAKHLLDQGKDAIFRIHEEPNPENMKEFYGYARLLGFQVPPEPTEEDLITLFERAQNSPLLEQLAIRFIRSMKLAIYSENNVGHFGLALENYTHFTSPIRRYSDLVVHRLLFDENYKPNLKLIALWCTEQERKSFKAEMSVIKLKKLRYLETILSETKRKIFPVTITNIKPMGIFFDLDFIGFEGFIHVSNLGSEYFHFDEKRRVFKGDATGLTYTIGKKIEVVIESIDLLIGECSWSLIK
jgi:ribonuclease R